MRRIAHISDLHFGTEEPGLARSLLIRLEALKPDFVAVSGDLVQRARDDQFRAARAFLDALPAPWLSVPGNHDIPLMNLTGRMVRPYAAYRRHISAELEPVISGGGVVLVCVNTVNRFAHQAGRFRRSDMKRLCRHFEAAGEVAVRVVMQHHPLIHAPDTDKEPMQNAEEALAALTDCGTDVILSGHLHAYDAAAHKAQRGVRETLLIQAGTAISTRRRGRENDFNLLTLDPGEVEVERWVARDDGDFHLRLVQKFLRQGDSWKSLPPVEHDFARAP